MRSRPALAALAVALSAAVLLADAPPAAAGERPPPVLIETGPARLLGLVNGDRAAAGLRPLVLRDDISAIARGHSLAMAAGQGIWHNDAYFTAGTRSRLAARRLGENVAVNGTVEDAHRRLMASPPHRANILNAGFDAMGIAVASDGVSLYVTESFIQSSTATAGRARPKRSTRPRARRVAHQHNQRVSSARS